MHLPMSNVDYKGMFAVDNGRALAKDPDRWGWRAVHSPLARPCLCYFKDCGRLKDGREAGHVAVYVPTDGVLVANQTYKWSPYWAKRIIGAFEPI